MTILPMGQSWSRSLHAVAAGALLALGVVGCTAAAPMATPATSSSPPTTVDAETEPTETPSASPVVADTVLISADAIRVTDAANTVILELPYSTSTADAITALSSVLGETPTTSVTPESVCADETTVTRWGGLRFLTPGGFAAGPGAQFVVVADGPTTAGGVTIIGSPGITVGEPISSVEVLASVRTTRHEGFVSIVAEPNGGYFGDDEAWGLTGSGANGVITQIGGPFYFYYDC